MDVIKNEHQPPKGGSRFNQVKKDYSLDFVYAESLSDIETGIKETIQGLDTANLAIAIAIARIEREALYIQAGYSSYQEYVRQCEDRLNLPLQTISDFRSIGEAYLQHKSKLQLIGFKEEGNLHKLRFLNRALEIHDEDDVFDRLKNDSYRKFREYAVDRKEPEEDQSPEILPEIEIDSRSIKVNGKNILRLDKDLDPETKHELTDILFQIFKIKMSGNRYEIVSLYDENEAVSIHRFLSRIRSKR